MIPVGHLAPVGCWDENLLRLLFDNELYRTGLAFKHIDGYPPKSGGVLVVPGRYWFDHVPAIEDAIASHEWVLLIRTGDEEDLFDVNQVAHPNIRFWVQSPTPGRDYGTARFVGVGFPPHFNTLPAEPPVKDTDVFLSAQNTHPRRNECFQALKDWDVNETDGFTKGLPPQQYVHGMVTAKIAPAPSGPVTADTFRLFEALESHAVPIADDDALWRLIFPDAPFPILTDYASLPGYINDHLEMWPANANRVAAWWMRQRRRYAHWLREDLEALGAL